MFPLLLAVPALIKGASDLLSLIDHPAAKAAVSALSDVTAAIDNKDIAPDQLKSANDHLEAMRQIEADQATAEQSEVEQTSRVEVISDDKYVRRMRPTFGYAMALSWTMQMMAISYGMIFNPDLAVQLISAMSQLTGLWGIGLAVLGIHFYGRTQEKRAALEGNPSLIQSLPTALGSVVGDAWAAATSKISR